ncbi:MAG: integrin, partial [Deltaproteobacteria bacterium]
PAITAFAVDVPLVVESTTVTATAVDPAAHVDIESVASGTGVASGTLTLALGTTEVRVTVTADGGTASYVVRVTRAGELAREAYLKASNTDTRDFGGSVTLSGDTLAVGAAYESSNALGSGGDQSDNSVLLAGAVYVFTRSGGVWTQQAYLKGSDTDAGDRFGASVALSGDTLAVGAWGEASNAVGSGGDQSDNSASRAGAVYVFTRSAGVWTQQAYLKASNADREDFFGGSVTLSGNTLVVGAWGEDSNALGSGGDQSDNSAPYAGAVYVFTRSAGVWTQQAYLKASNTDAFDRFGGSVTLSGNTLAVGAAQEASNAVGSGGDQSDNSASRAGAVYVFTPALAGVAEQQPPG